MYRQLASNENSCPQCRKARISDQIIKTFFSGLKNTFEKEKAKRLKSAKKQCRVLIFGGGIGLRKLRRTV